MEETQSAPDGEGRMQARKPGLNGGRRWCRKRLLHLSGRGRGADCGGATGEGLRVDGYGQEEKRLSESVARVALFLFLY
jgi:hypothetical protein